MTPYRFLSTLDLSLSQMTNGGCMRCGRQDVSDSPALPEGWGGRSFVTLGTYIDCGQGLSHHGEPLLCPPCAIELGRFLRMVPETEVAAREAEAERKLEIAAEKEAHAADLMSAAERVFAHFGRVAEPAPVRPKAKS